MPRGSRWSSRWNTPIERKYRITPRYPYYSRIKGIRFVIIIITIIIVISSRFVVRLLLSHGTCSIVSPYYLSYHHQDIKIRASKAYADDTSTVNEEEALTAAKEKLLTKVRDLFISFSTLILIQLSISIKLDGKKECVGKHHPDYYRIEALFGETSLASVEEFDGIS